MSVNENWQLANFFRLQGELNGLSADPASLMPLGLINPELKPCGNTVVGSEGCLSFPEIYGDIARPESVEVRALDREGKLISFKAGGLLARAIQHETDHLNGILFIDRMSLKSKNEHRAEIDELQAETRARSAKKKG